MKNLKTDRVVTPPKIAGIRSTAPIYRIAWTINRCFHTDFSLSYDWAKSGEILDSKHSHYFCRFEDVDLNWHLISNKGSEEYFLKTKPLFDALLICDGDDLFSYFDRAIQSVKASRDIEFIHPFDFNLVKSKDSFFSNILNTKYFIEDYLHVQKQFQ